MTATTTQYEIGSREWKIANLASSMRRHADEVDTFADDVEAWGWNPSARDALGLIERGEKFTRSAEKFHASEFIGRNTKASFLNDASIALGASNGAAPRGRGTTAYGLMHVLGEVEKVEDGTYNRIERSQSYTAVQASGLRVHASSCRVVAGLLDDLAAGKIWGIR